MSTHVRCDRCGDEHKMVFSDSQAGIRRINISVPKAPPHFEIDLCTACEQVIMDYVKDNKKSC